MLNLPERLLGGSIQERSGAINNKIDHLSAILAVRDEKFAEIQAAHDRQELDPFEYDEQITGFVQAYQRYETQRDRLISRRNRMGDALAKAAL